MVILARLFWLHCCLHLGLHVYGCSLLVLKRLRIERQIILGNPSQDKNLLILVDWFWSNLKLLRILKAQENNDFTLAVFKHSGVKL